MKQLALCLLLILPLGCQLATSPPPPTAPGFTSQTDQQLGSTLAAADAFYNKLQSDQKAGTFKPSAAEVTALNKLQAALAAANPVYLAYHNGTGSLAAAQSAVATVSSAQTSAQMLITGGK